jgi:2-dehydro-3-deoxygluconokinase
MVVVKDGAAGALLFTADGQVVIDPVPVKEVVDPVGAGDAFAAGVISGLLRGWPPVNGARLGAALGAAAVTHTGDWEAAPTGDWARELVKTSAPSAARIIEE